MFCGATSFNQSLNKWDVSKVTDMDFMFDDASSFNQPLDDWNVSKEYETYVLRSVFPILANYYRNRGVFFF